MPRVEELLVATAPAANACRGSTTTRAGNAAPSSGRECCCARASTRRSGRCTASSGSSASGASSETAETAGATPRPAAPYAYLIYPHKPIVAYLPQTSTLLNEYCVEFPDRHAAVRERAAAGLRRRARQVDGADRGRAAVDRHREHAPAGSPGRPHPGTPRPLAPQPLGTRAPAARATSRRRRKRPLQLSRSGRRPGRQVVRG